MIKGTKAENQRAEPAVVLPCHFTIFFNHQIKTCKSTKAC